LEFTASSWAYGGHVPVDSSGYGSTSAVRHAYQSMRPNIAVIASPRIKVVIDEIIPVHPASLSIAEGFGKKNRGSTS
jgi:hypothetical protein